MTELCVLHSIHLKGLAESACITFKLIYMIIAGIEQLPNTYDCDICMAVSVC